MLSIVDFELLTIVESLILRASEIQRWYQSPANLRPLTSSALRHQPSDLSHQPSYIFPLTSHAISLQTSAISLLTSYIFPLTSPAISLQTSAIKHQPYSIPSRCRISSISAGVTTMGFFGKCFVLPVTR